MDWDEENRLKQQEARECRDEAAIDFEKAEAVADAHHLLLKKISDAHYQLWYFAGHWCMNIYPGNHRLYADPNHKPPFLKVLPKYWNLMDVVQAAVKVLKG